MNGKKHSLITCDKVIAKRAGSINPGNFPSETFELYSIPAFDRDSPEIVTGRDIGSTKQIVQAGDVLLSKIVPHIRRTWVVRPVTHHRLIASGEWIIFRNQGFDTNFLRHLLVSDVFHRDFMATVSGVGGSLLRARPSAVAMIAIPQPPLEEQRRIASILDKTERLRRKREQSIRLADDFLQAVFLEMFGDPVTNTKGWDDSIVLDAVADIASGITKGRKVQGALLREVPYLAVSNVQDRYLKLNVVKTIAATETEIERYRLQEDDLLLTEGGDPDKLGRGCLWSAEIPECIHQNHVFRVRVTSSRVLPTYLNWLVGSKRGKQYFLSAAKQTTGIASINMRQLKSFPLLTPPLELQARFASVVERVSTMVETQRIGQRDIELAIRGLGSKFFFD